jgi:hypothetical protein
LEAGMVTWSRLVTINTLDQTPSWLRFVVVSSVNPLVAELDQLNVMLFGDASTTERVGNGSKVTVAALELVVEQTPLCTNASNSVVTVNGPVLNGLLVEAMAIQLLPPFVEYCHPMIAPV